MNHKDQIIENWLSHTGPNATFLPKATDYFSHMLQQRRKKVRLNLGSNSQPSGPESCSPLRHLSGDRDRQTDRQKDRQSDSSIPHKTLVCKISIN